MDEAADIKRFGKHRNAFGFLRLLFASLVIASHTPAMVDGNQSRDPLVQVFGTITFGTFAVDGFFLISGYLIVGSYLKLPAVWPYLKKRIARLYPAFLVASLFCVGIAASVGGAGANLLSPWIWVKAVLRAIALMPPAVPGAFDGTQFPALNGSIWTIAYEFRCYLLVLALGAAGAFHRPRVIVAAAICLLTVYALLPVAPWEVVWGGKPIHYLLGDLHRTLRLVGIFLAGAAFFLYRDRIKFTPAGSVIAGLGLIGCMFVLPLAEPALATFGAYLTFGFAAWGSTGLVSRINNDDDISYGVYLYAWPISKMLNWYWPAMPLAILGLLTFAIACLCGWLSWHYLEKPVMQRLR